MSGKEERLAQFVEVARKEMKEGIVCRWVQRCYETAGTVMLRVSDQRAAERFDALLWTFEDLCFIPHRVYLEGRERGVEPVLICTGGADLPFLDTLVDAAGGELYPGFDRFGHIIDFADLYDEKLKEAGRRRFKAYQSAGYRMRMIKLDGD